MKSRRLFWQSLVAVLAGNGIYFLLLMPHLPAAARHQPFRLDRGLLVDFWVCLLVFAVLRLFWRKR